MLKLRIALRYLLSHKSHNAVNVLSLTASAGVAVASAAMIIVLSVFNGFSDLAADRLSLLDADIVVKPSHGTVITDVDSVAGAIWGDDVLLADAVVENHALADADGTQVPVRLLGMSQAGVDASGMDGIMLDGVPAFRYTGDDRTGAIMSVGAAVSTGLRADPLARLRLYVPRRRGRLNPANPMGAFRADTLGVTGVYRVEQAEYDADMIIVPVETARHLLEYGPGEATSLRVYTVKPDDRGAVARIKGVLGEEYRVLDRREQQQQAFNMISVEKWVTFMILVCILVITSFNIISSIYILRIEKRGNVGVLRAMGCTRRFIRGVFTLQGVLITLAGGLVGLTAGCILTLLQEWYGFVKLQGGDPSMLAVDAYPVRLSWVDVAAVAGITILVSIICSLIATYNNKK